MKTKLLRKLRSKYVIQKRNNEYRLLIKTVFRLTLTIVYYGGRFDDDGWTDMNSAKAGLRFWVLDEAREKYKVPKSIL